MRFFMKRLSHIAAIPMMRYPAEYHKKVRSPVAKNSCAPTKNKPATIIGSTHNRLISLPAEKPQATEKMGLTAKNSNKHTIIPAWSTNAATNHGKPIIKITAAIVQKINFIIQACSLLQQMIYLFRPNEKQQKFQSTAIRIAYFVYLPCSPNKRLQHCCLNLIYRNIFVLDDLNKYIFILRWLYFGEGGSSCSLLRRLPKSF